MEFWWILKKFVYGRHNSSHTFLMRRLRLFWSMKPLVLINAHQEIYCKRILCLNCSWLQASSLQQELFASCSGPKSTAGCAEPAEPFFFVAQNAWSWATRWGKPASEEGAKRKERENSEGIEVVEGVAQEEAAIKENQISNRAQYRMHKKEYVRIPINSREAVVFAWWT